MAFATDEKIEPFWAEFSSAAEREGFEPFI